MAKLSRGTRSRRKTAFFTIVTPSHFAHARSLMETVETHSPRADRIVVVIGKGLKPRELEDSSFEVVQVSDWIEDDANLSSVAFKLNAFQLCCALKPYVARRLLTERGLEKLVYLDSDIRLYSSPKILIDELDRHPILLSPHLLDPSTSLNYDGHYPTEGTILLSGSFNMGFFAVDSSARAIEFLDWWRERTFFRCDRDIQNGFFDDQKWIDFVPSLFPEAHAIRHPGCNVAYWNLHERALKKVGRVHRCREERLVYFHFSGWSLDNPSVISPFQTRHSLVGNEALSELFLDYGGALANHGVREFRERRYEFDRFDNGLKIEPMIREIYKRVETKPGTNFGNPFATDDERSFFKWLIDPGPECVSPLALSLRSARPEIASMLPYPCGRNGNILIQEWAAKTGAKEAGLSQHWEKVMTVALASARGRAALAPDPSPKVDEVTSTRPPLGFGVNLIGFHDSEKRRGAAIRSSARCLAGATIPYRFCQVTDPRSSNLYASRAPMAAWGNEFAINLIHLDPADLESFVRFTDPAMFKGRINIGYWMWDLPDFPEKFDKWFSFFDEIWVPSTFVRDAIGKRAPIPVITIPYAIDTQGMARPADKRRKGPLTFLTSLDFDDFADRKNPEASIEAFRRAFPEKSERARLIVKSTRAHFHQRASDRLKNKIADDPRITWIDRVMPDAEFRALVASCDAYVSLHRSDAFGLVQLEALAMGKPVVATGYSGNNDFLDESTGFPVDFELTPMEEDFHPFEKGASWARPDVEHAARHLRTIASDIEAANLRAANGRLIASTSFNAGTIGAAYRRRLSALRAKCPRYV